MKSQQNKVDAYIELQKKKELYAQRMMEQKRLDAIAKATAERKSKNKVDLKSMANTMEKMSAMADEEIMRKSKVTNGK
jgi:response regulator of citrate/malate metabolism